MDVLIAILFIVIPLVISSKKNKTNQQKVTKPQMQQVWNQMQTTARQQMNPQERMRQKKAELQKKYKTTSTTQTVAKSLQKDNSIVDRAKINNAKLAEDETLKHDENAVLAEESLLGSIDDLMTKGYSGDLNFDRDFLGEAMDMIASFAVPDTVPDMVPDVMAKYQNA